MEGLLAGTERKNFNLPMDELADKPPEDAPENSRNGEEKSISIYLS
jgi:hypothetical protein